MTVLKFIVIFLCATSFVMAQKSSTKKNLEVVTVCDVLHNRSLYNGKTVALVGYIWESYHGNSVIDDCGEPLKTGDYVWDSAIWMDYDPTSETAFVNGVEYDKKAVKNKIAEMEQRMKGRFKKDEEVKWYIVFGQIETQEQLKTYSLRNEATPMGYGNMNDSPAQIIWKQRDIKAYSQ